MEHLPGMEHLSDGGDHSSQDVGVAFTAAKSICGSNNLLEYLVYIAPSIRLWPSTFSGFVSEVVCHP